MFPFSRTVRVPLRNGTITIQQVKIKDRTRLSTTSNLLALGILFTIVAYAPLPQRVLPSELQTKIKRFQTKPDVPDEAKHGEHWHKRHGEIQTASGSMPLATHVKKGAWFIPMSLAKKEPGQPFVSTDPEWQAFLKLVDDEKRLKELKREVANNALKDAVRLYPRHFVLMGKIEKLASGLEIQPILRRPPVYSRSGLLVMDGISNWRWVTMLSPEQRTHSFHKVFVDLPFFWGFWAGSKAFCKYYYNASTSYFSATSTSRKNPAEKSQVQTLSQPSKVTKVSVDITPMPSACDVSPKSQREPSTRPRSLELLRSLVPKPKPDSALQAASQAFREAFSRSWIEASRKHVWPPGVCVLRGEVDVHGARGKVRLRLICVYHPERNVIVAQAINKIDWYPKKWMALGDIQKELEEWRSSKG